MFRRCSRWLVALSVCLAVPGPGAEAPALLGAQAGEARAARAAQGGTNLNANAQGVLSRDEIVALIREVAAHDEANEKVANDYTYTERVVRQNLDHQGNATSTDSKTYEVTMLDGDPVRKLVARNDQPLSAEDAAKEERRIEDVARRRENEPPEERQKRLAKEQKERQEQREFVQEVADAYDFRALPSEAIDGRPVWVLDGEPRAGFKPHGRQAKILTKFHIRVWIDQAQAQWVKLDANAIETVTWGGFIARIHKGSRMEIEQTQVNDEVWLPKHAKIVVDARVALVKSYDFNLDVSYRDYKKFRVSTRSVPAGDLRK
jgi:hypothetical protein